MIAISCWNGKKTRYVTLLHIFVSFVGVLLVLSAFIPSISACSNPDDTIQIDPTNYMTYVACETINTATGLYITKDQQAGIFFDLPELRTVIGDLFIDPGTRTNVTFLSKLENVTGEFEIMVVTRAGLIIISKPALVSCRCRIAQA
jgi:hypothetical protein